MLKYDSLREHALANFEVLLDYWKVEYRPINSNEFDLIAKWREDADFGAVRFNTFKNRGSDFAGISIAGLDPTLLGNGFDKGDFAGFTGETNTNSGFDIIGLCQRVYNLSDYRTAAERLVIDLQTLSKDKSLAVPSMDAAKQRAEALAEQNRDKIKYAQKMWKFCKAIPLKESKGDIYLTARGLPFIYQKEKVIRFHPKVMNSELKKPVPTLLFKVSYGPDTELIAIHRIYLSDDGWTKANVSNPKMALASIKGAAIWFGTPSNRLAIAEGPENALTIRELGSSFVCSTINATNFANIKIPEYVEHIELYPDPDDAGRINCQKAVAAYHGQGKTVVVKYPPQTRVEDKLLDWNDILQETVKYERHDGQESGTPAPF